MTKITGYAAALLLGFGVLAGCSGSGGSQPISSSATTSVVGKVADGYLANAVVFLDKNGNYQLDAGEPNTTSDQTGSFTLTIDPADVGNCPLVALAIKDQTVDLDTPDQKVQNTYILSMHAVSVTPATAGTVTGSVHNFISPISTLIRETLEANAGMTLAEAVTQARNQLNLPADINIQSDYIFGSYSGGKKPHYQQLHQAARQMAGLMGDQSGLVMNGRTPQLGRYREMLGQIGSNLPQLVDNIMAGGIDNSTMNLIRETVHNSVAGIPATAGLGTLSSLFSCYTSKITFWSMSSGRMRPMPPRWR